VSRRILFLASLPLVATFISLLATPASSASLQSQQKPPGLLLANNNRNPGLIAGLFGIFIDLNNYRWHRDRDDDRWRDRDDQWHRDRDDRWGNRDDRWRGRDDRWRDRDDRWRDRDDRWRDRDDR